MYVAEDKADGKLYGPFETEHDFQEWLESGEYGDEDDYRLREIEPI